jgi:tetratricopeptide (TPR) repeat protein
VLISVLLGCSSSQRQIAVAERLDRSGHTGDALALYEKIVAKVPAGDAHQRSDLFFRIGECRYRLDQIPEAFTAFQRAAELDPRNLAAHLRLGEFYLAAGAAERARDQAELVLKTVGSNSEALALWGAALAATGQNAFARDAYERVLRMDPKRVSVALALADLYNRDEQVKQAKQVLLDSAKANPGSATPWLAVARIDEQEGEVTAAEAAYRHAVSVEDTPESNLRLAQFLQRTARITEAEQVLRRVDAQRPSQPTALPDFELMAGKAGDALDRYLAALSSNPAGQKTSRRAVKANGEVARDRALLATRLVEADIEVADQKLGEEKKAALQRAHAHVDEYRVDLDPATVAILQAEIAISDADLPMAIMQAKTAVSLAPHSAPAHYVLGLVQYRAGEDPRSQWLAALDSDSHFAPARLALAEQGLAAGDAKAAEDYVVGVVRDEPGNVRALNLFARVLLAEKRHDAAALIAHRALAVGGSASEPHLLLGQVALRQHKLGEALIHFEQAVLLRPHSADAIEGLTRVYQTGSVTRPMLAKMEKVATASPPSATLMEIVGRLYADRGWYEDAKRSLATALRMDPQRTTAAAALARTFAATGELGAAADSASLTGGRSAALLAGVRAQEQNDVASAIENYERAIREGEHSGVAANNLAWLYAEQGSNLDRALELAQAATSMSPGNPAVLDTVGVVQLKLRKYTEAIKALEAARRIAGEQASDPQLLTQIRRHLTEAYLRAGRTDAAATSQDEAESVRR